MAKTSIIKGAHGQSLWVYETGGGETLASIGARYLLFNQPEAIAAYNGLDEFQASASFVFSPNESIAVPVEWVLPEYRKAMLVADIKGGAIGAPVALPGTVGGMSNTQIVLIAGAALLALAALK